MIRFFIFFFIGTFLILTNSFAKNSYYEKALKFFNEKDFNEAKFYFEKNIVFNPKDELSYFYLSKIASINKDKLQEKLYLDSVLVLNPKNENALYRKIIINIDEGDFAKAKESNLIFVKVCKELCDKKEEISKAFPADKK
ncbi:MAG: hypothetical protein FJ373_02665 [Pelagibacterales bacterium]|jgi:tetratricopeptide (TPR) repeat protein|nr:hypothetical protein [Pelagibacterales bacterium]